MLTSVPVLEEEGKVLFFHTLPAQGAVNPGAKSVSPITSLLRVR